MIRTLQERFVCVTGDDWYRRRQQDRVGEFFRSVADQSDKKGEDGATRQGLYCFTSGGKLLGWNNHQRAEGVKRLLTVSLAAWEALPAEGRAPREFNEPDGEPDPDFARELPDAAIAVRVHARELEDDGDGGYRPAPSRQGVRSGVSLDHLWLRKGDLRQLPLNDERVGATAPVPPAVVRRIVRFHLIDNTRGEPPMWQERDVREAEMRLMVATYEDNVIRLSVSGHVHLETDDGERGYEADVDGVIEADLSDGRIRRFDLVALGEHWGEGRYTPGSRPGKAPLGVAFTLADGSQVADRVPPQAARDIREYWGR